jgi:hypothetical protein
MGQLANGILHLAKVTVKPGFELRQRDVRYVPIVKKRKGEAKLGPKLLQGQLRSLSLDQNMIGRLPYSRQIVHQGSRPIENHVPNHEASLAAHRDGTKV